MSVLKALARGAAADKLYVDDVFSIYTFKPSVDYTPYSIASGQDLATRGGMVTLRARNVSGHWSSFDSVRGSSNGAANALHTNNANAETDQYWDYISSFNNNGFSVGFGTGGGQYTNSGVNYVAHVLCNAYNFFQVLKITKTAGSNRVIDLSPYMAVVGAVTVKNLATGSWYKWHRSLSAGKLLIGEAPDAETTLGHITVVGTTLTLVNGVIADGDYHIEAYAHDTSADGIIQCVSFTTDASGNATVTTGWESQHVELKASSSTSNCFVFDAMRDFHSMSSGSDTPNKVLFANTSGAESTEYVSPTATGFKVFGFGASTTYVGLAIRRPNKPPTAGTQVYNAIARTGTGAAATVTGVGFPPDLMLGRARALDRDTGVYDRLRGAGQRLITNGTAATEVLASTEGTMTQDGVIVDGNNGYLNGLYSYINHFFRRAPVVFDQACYDGSGANKTEAHNLTVQPEIWRAKRRNGSGSWVYGSIYLAATEKIVMPSPNGKVTDATAWNSTYPTASVISLGTLADVNASGGTYEVELWATLAGVSKCGKYTGNGSALNVECGFTTGARYVEIIRITAGVAQDIFVFDTTRGIIAANDPHLSLNTTAAEVTTDDSIDPYAGGFTVNQVAATNINVNGAEYLFRAIA